MGPIRLASGWRAAGLRAEERLARRARRLGRVGVVVPLAVAACAFAVFAGWAPRGLANGDAAVYAEQIENRAFGDRSVHVGYTVTSGLLLGFPERVSDHWLNWLAAAFAAATVGLVARVALVVTGRPALGVAAGVALFASWTFVREATVAEVYAPQVFFLVLAAWAWARGAAASSGVALAVSVLHTPSSLFAVPAFAVLRPDARRIAILGAVGGVITLVVLAFVWRDYFHGPRGLLAATAGGLGPVQRVVKEGVEVIFGVFALLPFVVLGAWRLLRRRQWPALVAFAVGWGVTFVLGERFADVPVQLPTWTALALVAALGLAELEVRLRAAGPWRRRAWLAGVGGLALVPLAALAVVRGRSSVFARVDDERIVAMAILVAAATGLAAALSLVAARRAARVQFVGAAAAGLLLVATLASAQRTAIDTYRRQVLDLAPHFVAVDGAAATAGPPAFAVAGWSGAILFERYLFGASYSGPVINVEWWREGGGEQGERLRRRRDAALAAGADVWLLGDYPGPRADLEARGWVFEPAAGDFERGVRRSAADTPPSSGGPP